MPKFDEQPLASLTFTGGLDDDDTFFKLDPSNPKQKLPTTAIEAFDAYITDVLPPQYDTTFNGKRLEFLGAISFVLASRASQGSFFKFVERFVHHLALSKMKWICLTEYLSPNCRTFLEKLVVPFCAPLASVWDEDMKELLQANYQEASGMSERQSKMLVGGTCQLHSYTQEFDLTMKNGLNAEVIAVEFKLHNDALSGNDLKVIFDKLYQNSECNVGILVGLKFDAALEKEETWIDLPKNYSIYSLDRVLKTADNPNVTPVSTLRFYKKFPVHVPGVHSEDLQFNLHHQIDEMNLNLNTVRAEKRSIGREKRKRILGEEPFIIILISLLDLNP